MAAEGTALTAREPSMTPKAVRRRRQRAHRKRRPELREARFWYDGDHAPDMLVWIGKLDSAAREDPAAISAAIGDWFDACLRAWLKDVACDNSGIRNAVDLLRLGQSSE